MKLTIHSLRGTEFEGEAAGFNVKTVDGEITVLDHHLPLISVLDKGAAHIIDREGNRKRIQVQAGFLEMTARNELTVLLD